MVQREPVGQHGGATAPFAGAAPLRVAPATVSRGSTGRRLLAAEAFERVMEPLVGRRVGYVRPHGHVGDALIEMAMTQLFAEFGVEWSLLDLDAPVDIDTIVFGGGGSMGRRSPLNHALRTRALALGPPVVVLPQSFTDREERPFARVFVRERASLGLCPTATLAPDLALGLSWPTPPPPTQDLGVFLRRDQERTGRRLRLARDPVELCQSPEGLLALVACYRRIITDRLHCAIAGLHAGRDVTLLPNNYHKNRSMHETWLAALGCRFAESVEAALFREAVAARRAAA
jgi:exopolysaccharide biosynthesis predicted pyruvyltransferase EpsI